jgi:Flp pilus assembly CpaF family ATPase
MNENVSPPKWGWALHSENLTRSPWKKTWPILSTEEIKLLEGTLHLFYQNPSAQQSERALVEALDAYMQNKLWVVEPDQQTYLETILHDHALGAGPLTPLMDTTGELEEIGINGVGPSFPVRVYHTRTGWEETPLYFSDASYLIALLNRLTMESGIRLSAQTPIINARIQNGLRLHAAIHPVCQTEVEASIRKFVLRPTHPYQLIETGIWSPGIVAYLELALACDCNLLIAGNTGSGKTTTLNALSHLFPKKERLILIEETPELNLSHPHQVKLSPKSETSIDMARLIRESLRMRPDRVIVGEIRFPEEAKAFMEAILAGQGKGTYSTFHGHSSRETIARLHQYGILEQDLGWINVLLIQRRWSMEWKKDLVRDVRRVTEIVEMEYDEEAGLKIHPVFTYSPAQKKWSMNESKVVASRIPFHFPHSTFEMEWKKRETEAKKGKQERGKK